MAYWFAPKRARSEAASSHHDTGAEHGIVHPAARSSIGSPVLDFVEGFALWADSQGLMAKRRRLCGHSAIN